MLACKNYIPIFRKNFPRTAKCNFYTPTFSLFIRNLYQLARYRFYFVRKLLITRDIWAGATLPTFCYIAQPTHAHSTLAWCLECRMQAKHVSYHMQTVETKRVKFGIKLAHCVKGDPCQYVHTRPRRGVPFQPNLRSHRINTPCKNYIPWDPSYYAQPNENKRVPTQIK